MLLLWKKILAILLKLVKVQKEDVMIISIVEEWETIKVEVKDFFRERRWGQVRKNFNKERDNNLTSFSQGLGLNNYGAMSHGRGHGKSFQDKKK